jgi:uncharacterized protein YkwD
MISLSQMGLGIALAFGLSGMSLACTLPDRADESRAEVAKLINQQRLRSALTALKTSARLDAAAQSHACDNADQQQISHEGSDGSDLRDRFRRVGYKFRAGNENVGNFTDAAAMVAAWMGSQGHRRNILDRNVQELGVGVAIGADRRTYWVTVSAAPR